MMALLGVQLILTMVTLTILHKLSLRFSFARWILSHRLVRYLHPTDEELKAAAGGGTPPPRQNQRNRAQKRHDHNGEKKQQTFMVPKDVNVVLERAPIQSYDLIQLHYYPEYQWLLDFAVCCVMVYFGTEIYYFIYPQNPELNLSLVWSSLVIVFTMKTLASLTWIYFKGGEEAMGEQSLCLTSGLLFFLMAMIVLVINENFLEFGLDAAYESFHKNALNFVRTHGFSSSSEDDRGKQAGPITKLFIKLWLAVWSGFMGAFFAFPGLRFAQMHKHCLAYAGESQIRRALFNFNFICPILAILLWIKPIARDYLTLRTWGSRGTIMTSDSFETMRILLILLIVLIRFIALPSYIQAYLNLAAIRFRNLKKEGGKISNIDLQKMIARIFYYLCVVALQYTAPLLLCLFTTLMMKTLGNYYWTPSLAAFPEEQTSSAPLKDSSDLSLMVLRQIFNPIVFRGLLGYMTWWICTTWFITSVVGYAYHSYFV